jgi:hypothetical protein
MRYVAMYLLDCLGKQQYIVGKNNIFLAGFGNSNILLNGFGKKGYCNTIISACRYSNKYIVGVEFYQYKITIFSPPGSDPYQSRQIINPGSHCR